MLSPLLHIRSFGLVSELNRSAAMLPVAPASGDIVGTQDAKAHGSKN